MNTAVMERVPLISIIGTVLGINPAPAPNRSGKIKLTDGQILNAFPDKLAMIEAGGTYDFGCTRTDKGTVIYHDVKAVRAVAPNPPRQANFLTREEIEAQRRPVPPPQQKATKVQESQNGNGNHYRPTHPRDGERMFVCSILNAFIQTGRIADDVATLTNAVRDLRQVWQETFGQDDAAA